ncbi:pyridoxamine 5'-phosphate oxidase family protein [Chloroflexota bacterium]
MDESADTKYQIKLTLEQQHFAVLSTINNQQPYSNLVAYVVSTDLRYVVFATNRNTQKYRNIFTNNSISLLIDNRRNRNDDYAKALAITALDTASEIENYTHEELVHLYLRKHKTLTDFIGAQDTAIIKMQAIDYIIARFGGAKRVSMESVY